MLNNPDRLLIVGITTCSILILLLLSGCAHVPQITYSDQIGRKGPAGECARFLARLDQAVKEDGVRDAGAFRIKSHPYLRTNRFLSSFSQETAGSEAFQAWVDRLQELDQRARYHEINNLQLAGHAWLPSSKDKSELYAKVKECGSILRKRELNTAAKRNKLRQLATAPDDYITLRRVAGMYPVVATFVLQAVAEWQDRARKNYSPTPATGQARIRYFPAFCSISGIRAFNILKKTKFDALGIPKYRSGLLKELFRIYAPIWEVEAKSADDHIGSPQWEDNRLTVNIKRPVTFTRLSYTRFRNTVLTQLNYIIWFPARPQANCLDLLSGFLDGLNYRVTLDKAGKPLLYETMHNCGCYHRFFATKRLKLRQKIEYKEPPLVLKAPELNPASHRMVVSMQSGTHYVQHLYGLSGKADCSHKKYQLSDYNKLRSLPQPKGGNRGLFQENSLVPGSQRLERVILWPSGVLSPGAMRQWGRHALAFAGKRHFDDPRLIERIFKLVPSNTTP